MLDVTTQEDQARHRKDHGPENWVLLRRLALNIVRRDPAQDSRKGKRQRAG